MGLVLKRLAVFAIVVATIVLVYVFVDPTSHQWMPKCPFRQFTGLSCPGCGMQRFLHALLHGHVLSALRYNYWLALVLPYAASLVVAWLLPDGSARNRLRTVVEHRWMVWSYLASFLLWGVVRNALHI